MIEDLKKYDSFDFSKTKFLGFTTLTSSAKVLALFDSGGEVVNTLQGHGYVIFDQTPFYALSGGQASDKGIISINQKSFPVLDVRKDIINKYYIHEIESQEEISVGQNVVLTVDKKTRQEICKNHSALHITWFTIMKIVGHHVDEVGSKLDEKKYQLQIVPDNDVSSDVCLHALEIVNQQVIADDIKANIFSVTYEEALEKNWLFEFTKVDQDEMVRMVEFPNVVIEPCGGTHVSSTKEIEKIFFLNYDKNNKRILVEYTANKDYAVTYFEEKIYSKLTQINRLMEKHPTLNFKEQIVALQNLPKEDSYLKIQQVNKIFTDVSLVINKKMAELRKERLNEFLTTELSEEHYGNISLIALADNLVDGKSILAKAAALIKSHPDKVFFIINKSEEDVQGVLMCDRNSDFDCKSYVEPLFLKTSFRGGGSSSMMQFKSQDFNDYETAITFAKLG